MLMNGHGLAGERVPPAALVNLPPTVADGHRVVLAHDSFGLDGEDPIQIAAPAASKGGAVFRRFHAELLVELLEVMLAQKPVGLLQRLDAGQTQFLRQPSLPGPQATLRAPSRLR